MKRYISATTDPRQEIILINTLFWLIWFVITFLLAVMAYVDKQWEDMYILILLYPTMTLIYLGKRKTAVVVAIEDSCLFVSNGKKETKIPFSNIDRISESPGPAGRGYDIKVVFKTRSLFGKCIRFAPGGESVSQASQYDIPKQPRTFWASLHPSHPVAEELRYLINNSTDKREQESS